VPDVFSLVLDDFETKAPHTRQDLLNLYGDGHLIVVAGGYVLSLLSSRLVCHV